MSSSDPIVCAVEHCETMAALFPELSEKYYQVILNCCQQKLWHQLTITVLEFVSDDTNARTIHSSSAVSNDNDNSYASNSFVQLYENVVSRFESKLHPLSTARIAVAISNSLLINHPTSGIPTMESFKAAKSILDTLLENYQLKLTAAKNEPSDLTLSLFRSNKKKDSTFILMEAVLYLQSKSNLITLHKMYLEGGSLPTEEDTVQRQQQLSQILKLIESNSQILQEWSSASINPQQKSGGSGSATSSGTTKSALSSNISDASIVHAAHYEQGMAYYKLIGPPEAFYEQAMEFLTHAPPSSLSSSESGTSEIVDTEHSTKPQKFGVINYHQLAVDLCLAALTGEGVYDLGKVEQTPCLTLLQNTPEAWLAELFKAVSYGQVLQFQQLTQQYATQIQQQPALTTRASAVEEKLTLMALMEYVVWNPNKSANIKDAEWSRSSIELTLENIATALHRPLDQVEYVIMRACSVNLMSATIDQVDGTVLIKWVVPRVLNSSQMVDLASQFKHWSFQVHQMESFMKEHTQTLFA